MNTLYEAVLLSQKGDNDATMQVINKFRPLIKKYSYKLNYDDAEADLTAFLIKIIKKLPVNKNLDMRNDGCIVNYIHKSLTFQYFYLYKKVHQINSMEICLEMDISIEDDFSQIENSIMLEKLLEVLPEKQKTVIKGIYIENRKQSEIASELKVSRQAIYRIKKQALENSKKLLGSIR